MHFQGWYLRCRLYYECYCIFQGINSIIRRIGCFLWFSKLSAYLEVSLHTALVSAIIIHCDVWAIVFIAVTRCTCSVFLMCAMQATHARTHDVRGCSVWHRALFRVPARLFGHSPIHTRKHNFVSVVSVLWCRYRNMNSPNRLRVSFSIVCLRILSVCVHVCSLVCSLGVC